MPSDTPAPDARRAIERRIKSVTRRDLDAFANRLGSPRWSASRLDEDKLPADLRDRARRYHDTRAKVRRNEFAVGATAARYGVAILALLGMYPLLGYILEPAAGKLIAMAAAWSLAAVVAAIGYLAYRDPVRTTDRERNQIAAATSSFTLPLTAEGIPHPKSDPYGTIADIREQWKAGKPRREAQLVYIADSIINDIRNSPAWADPVFDTHRVRLDLTLARREIFEHAAQLWQIDSAVIPPATVQSSAHTQWRQHQDTVDDAWTALVARVDALYAYREGMRPVEVILQDLAAVQSLTTSANRIQCLDDLFTATAKAQLETDQTRRVADELPELAANLQAQLDFLRTGAIHMPALATPLPLATN